MRAAWLIALNTFRQTVRQRLFYNIGIFGLGMIIMAMVIGQITFGYPDRVVRSIGLSGVALALNVIALLVSVTLIQQEIEKKTAFVVLARPLHRYQYVLGRYFGLLLALLAAQVGLSVLFVGTLLSVGGEVSSQDLWALLMNLPEAAILGAVGLVLSTFSTPTLSAGISIGVWIAAASLDDLVGLTRKLDAFTRTTADVVSWVLPNFARLNFREAAIYAIPVELTTYLASLAYGVVYVVALLGLASAIFSRREMV